MKKVLSLILAIMMVMSCVIVTATAAGTGPELVYTVDFRGNDGKYKPTALNDNASKYTYTPSADGTSLTIDAVTELANDAKANAWWGGKIDGLVAKNTTAYTMTYQLKANGATGTNNSIGVGGWITNGDLSTTADAINKIYNMYGNHNTYEVVEGATVVGTQRRSKLQLGKGELAAYVAWNTLPAYEEDAEGFVTLKQVYNGGDRTFTAYVLADGKTGSADADWIKIASGSMELDSKDDAFGFAIYSVYGAVNTTVKNVNIYKETVVPTVSDADVYGTCTPNTSYDLTITEICNAPENAEYEYIEIMNTSNGDINLKDYYLLRFGFSHGGKYEYSGVGQLAGVTSSQRLVKFTPVSLEDHNVTLAKGEVAVIWFAGVNAKDMTADHFRSYWKESGAEDEIDSVKIVRYENYVVTTDAGTGVTTVTAKYPASYINPAEQNKTTFLPDLKAGFGIGLMKASKMTETVQVYQTKEDGNRDTSKPQIKVAVKDLQQYCDNLGLNDKGKMAEASLVYSPTTQRVIRAMDSFALCYTYGSVDSGYSYNFYSNVNEQEYKAATATPGDYASNSKTPSVPAVDTLIPSMVWGQSKVRAYWNTTSNYNNATASSGALYVDSGTRLLPSPGKLWNEQFGTDGDIPSFDAAKGVSSIVVIRWTPEV